MVSNSTKHPLTYEELTRVGFSPVGLLRKDEDRIPRYLRTQKSGVTLTLVQDSLESQIPPSTSYRLHNIILPTGKEYHLANSEFPSIEKQLDSLENLIDFLENPSTMLETLLNRIDELSYTTVEDLDIEQRCILGDYP